MLSPVATLYFDRCGAAAQHRVEAHAQARRELFPRRLAHGAHGRLNAAAFFQNLRRRDPA